MLWMCFSAPFNQKRSWYNFLLLLLCVTVLLDTPIIFLRSIRWCFVVVIVVRVLNVFFNKKKPNWCDFLLLLLSLVILFYYTPINLIRLIQWCLVVIVFVLDAPISFKWSLQGWLIVVVIVRVVNVFFSTIQSKT
jgi:hypothetical protein